MIALLIMISFSTHAQDADVPDCDTTKNFKNWTVGYEC